MKYTLEQDVKNIYILLHTIISFTFKNNYFSQGQYDPKLLHFNKLKISSMQDFQFDINDIRIAQLQHCKFLLFFSGKMSNDKVKN